MIYMDDMDMMDDAIFRDAFHWIIDFQTYEVRMKRKNGCELRSTRTCHL